MLKLNNVKMSTAGYFLISVFLLLSILSAPRLATAQDTESITVLKQMGNTFAKIAEDASPAVVGIEVERTVTYTYTSPFEESPFGEPFNPFGDDLFRRFFRQRSPQERSPQRKQKQTAKGSGFIISPDGYILTNNHLVGETDKVTVKLQGAQSIEAKVIGADKESDVAVIKIDKENLPYLELADSDEIQVGEWVLAIGNPFGLSHTVTAGIVSAKGRSNIGLAAYEDFIQTDAAINPGNSGGPLLSLDGKVVGMNTAIIGAAGNIGIGLAIPINMAKQIYEQFMETGEVVRGYLGIYMNELTPDLAEALGLEGTKGVAISQVIDDSPAADAGLKHNDVIIEFNGKKVQKANELKNRVAVLTPGTKVELVVLRDGKKKTIIVELTKRPNQPQLTAAKSDASELLGINVQNITKDLVERLGLERVSGVVVSDVQPGSISSRAGIKTGMVIQEVNRNKINNTKDFYTEIEKVKKGDNVLLLIYNGTYSQFVVLSLPKD